MTREGWVLLLAAVLGPFACTQKTAIPAQNADQDGSVHSGGGATGTGGSGGFDGSIEAGGDGGDCNTLVNAATAVGEQDIPESVPGAQGGTVQTGTYHLTAVSTYTGINGNSGPTGNQFQETVFYDVASYDDVKAVGSGDAGVGADTHVSGTYSTAGAQLTLQASCPAPASVVKNYSVIGSTLHTFVNQTEYIYTLQ